MIHPKTASIWCFDIVFWMIWVLGIRSELLEEENSVTIWHQNSHDTRLGDAVNAHCKISVSLTRLSTVLTLKTTNDEKKKYFGVSEITKTNYVNYRNSTEFSKYIWQSNDLNITPKISWEIATVIRCAAICLTEKLFIIKSFDNNQLLNKKS